MSSMLRRYQWRLTFVCGVALLLALTRSVFACPDCEEEKCVPLLGCACVPKIGCTVSIPTPGTTTRGSVIPTPTVPFLPPAVQREIERSGNDVSRNVEKFGNDTLTTMTKANMDTVRTLEKAGGDLVATVQKAGSDTVTTVHKAANDATATYVKAWRDAGEQAKSTFNDVVEAGQAVARFVSNRAKAYPGMFENADKRLRDGKVIDSMWGLATEPAQTSEEHFAKATQDSKLLNTAAHAVATAYGGPAGAAAYAAWATYRATGNADLALRAAVLSAVTSQAGSNVSSLPSGAASEAIKKAALAGAAGGIAVAAAGGDEQAIKDGFLKSAGAVVIQAGTDNVKAYSPKAKDAYDAVQCISAKDVDCLSNTTYARDLQGKLLYDADGNPRIDPKKLDPKLETGKWSGIDTRSPAGKAVAFMTQISKLPKAEAIPIMQNQWVLTWTLGKPGPLEHNRPTVVLTYVGNNPPFRSNVEYGRAGVTRALTAEQIRSNKRSYSCRIGASVRSVRSTATASGCHAVYTRDDGTSQVVWHSDHFPEICAPKTDMFANYLEGLGMKCGPN